VGKRPNNSLQVSAGQFLSQLELSVVARM
jgi:hypothetical protein